MHDDVPMQGVAVRIWTVATGNCSIDMPLRHCDVV
jgi:hypothetical protein